MIISNPVTEIIYFKVYQDYFKFPRNKTSPHNSASSYCRKTDTHSGIFFIEYDFFICDDYTKEPFFVYRTKNSFNFTVENEEKDLTDLNAQKFKLSNEISTFIKDNSQGYPFDDLNRMFNFHSSLDLVIGQGFYL